MDRFAANKKAGKNDSGSFGGLNAKGFYLLLYSIALRTLLLSALSLYSS